MKDLPCPQLTTELLRVSDPDSSPEELLFSSMGNLNPEAGYLEHEGNLGRLVLLHQRYPLLIKHKAHFLVFHYNRKFSETWNCTVQKLIFSFRPINLFSLGDLEEGKISYVHTGVLASRLALRVSDGHKVSYSLVFTMNPLKSRI